MSSPKPSTPSDRMKSTPSHVTPERGQLRQTPLSSPRTRTPASGAAAPAGARSAGNGTPQRGVQAASSPAEAEAVDRLKAIKLELSAIGL